MLAGLALVGGALLANCNKSDSTSDVGTLRLALKVPPNGPIVNLVSWQIFASDGTTVLRSGNINTSDQNATASVDTSCPAGTGDKVVMNATATDGTHCTGTSAPFNVAAGGTVMVGVQLTCGGSTFTQGNGSVIVNGTFINGNNCPGLTSWVASPLVTSVGGTIDLAVTATDADTADVLTYSWTGSNGGTFSAQAATSVFTCGAAGAQTLTVVVNDNHQPTPCTATMTFPVTCINVAVCGNNVIEPGEQCDPPNNTTCNSMCQLNPTCGNGVLDPGEQCDPRVPLTGNPNCNPDCTLKPVCGNGIIEMGEQCDPPNGTTCSPTCQTIVPKCPADTACTLCEQSTGNADVCPPENLSVPGQTAPACFGCAGFSPGNTTATNNCNALLSCIRTMKCANGDDPTPCYCGNLDPGTCVTSGAPTTAPCFAQYTAAAMGFSGNVFTQFFDPKTPIGIADNLVSCDADAHMPGPCVCP
jgi:hypothetical protein